MNYILLATSILLETAKNVFSNNFSKNSLKNETDIYKFNTLMYLGSFLVLCFFKSPVASLFTVLLAVLFAVALWFNQYAFLKALKYGTMGFTTFIQGVSLVIPIIFGAIVWNEKIKLHQYVWLVILVASLWLALNIKKEKFNTKWLLFSVGAMTGMGVISILQSVHQMSSHRNELIAFLRIAFLFTVIINLLGWAIRTKKEPSCFKIKSGAVPMAAFSGIFMGTVHIINLFLAGAMQKIIFFPTVNGGLIFVTLISGLVFFKERLTIIQWIGIIIGTIALNFIGI